jgi:hypothetical protein
MKDYIPLLTGLITGLFTLAGLYISNLLNNKKETRKALRDEKITQRDKVHTIYTDFLIKLKRAEAYIKYGKAEADNALILLTEHLYPSVIGIMFFANQKVRDLADTYIDTASEWQDKYEEELKNCTSDIERKKLMNNELVTEELKALRYKNDYTYNQMAEAMEEHLKQIIN